MKLEKAYFNECINMPYTPMACPSEGAFTAWKTVEGRLIKLQIPEDALRSSATTRKCRSNKAKVLGIYDFYGNLLDVKEIVSYSFGKETHYKVGEMVYPDRFDEDRYNECSNGIHFFINRQDAVNYYTGDIV